MSKIIRIATRKSQLALWQANSVREQLLAFWPELKIELLPMTTSGDQFLKDKLIKIGGKGLFVKELEDALFSGKADIAVHSMKDVPVDLPEGMKLAVICKRHNPFDAFVSNQYDNIDSLPKHAVIGTSSLRRQSQLLAISPTLVVKPLRGNIHTRLEKMETENLDGIILAAAGLLRMGMASRIRQILTPEVMLPACGQGALGIECRENDTEILNFLKPLHDDPTAQCVMAERKVNALLGGNCHTPLAVFCELQKEEGIFFSAKVASADGKKIVEYQQKGLLKEVMNIAEVTVEALLQRGAQKLLES